MPRSRPLPAREGRETIAKMCGVAELTRGRLHQRRPVDGHEPAHGDHLGARTPPFSAMSPFAFRVTFLNKCDELERTLWPNNTSASSASS